MQQQHTASKVTKVRKIIAGRILNVFKPSKICKVIDMQLIIRLENKLGIVKHAVMITLQ